ncbi:hypothetical protein KUV56_13755 [Ferrimonas balearica]|uniref:hypothetical protein n=1 Tax=Ferrimonas balearica TaxID=44012 RepID=UPI001C5699F7|nr:hypothetical protein [Ferrimonas balearica]MBW3140561.1 hypothetical protein [Ferrimonas balearica]
MKNLLIVLSVALCGCVSYDFGDPLLSDDQVTVSYVGAQPAGVVGDGWFGDADPDERWQMPWLPQFLQAVESELIKARLTPAQVQIQDLLFFTRPASHFPTSDVIRCTVDFTVNGTPVHTELSTRWHGYFAESAFSYHVPHCIEQMLRDAQDALASQPPRDNATASR